MSQNLSQVPNITSNNHINDQSISLKSPGFARDLSNDSEFFLRPLPMLSGAHTKPVDDMDTLPIAGGPLMFNFIEITEWDGRGPTSQVIANIEEITQWSNNEPNRIGKNISNQLFELTTPRENTGIYNSNPPCIMGILNVTPDSFFDGGKYNDVQLAIERGEKMVEAGADIIDVGGESTRPGAEPISEHEELNRVIPVIEALAASGKQVSIDTRRASVMREAAKAGAKMINDISALSNTENLEAAAETGLPVVLMHSNADPRTMQNNPSYLNAPLEVFKYLRKRIIAAESIGIPKNRIIIDPGIGFAKTVFHNSEILRNLTLYHGLGCLILLGVSRKSFIGKVSADEEPNDRLSGSIAAALWAASQGVQILRVHDIAETTQALSVWQASSQEISSQ